MIVTLSKINETLSPEAFREHTYHASDGMCFTGRQTNEGPTRYFIYQLAERGELFDRIILLVTDECMSTKIPAVGGRVTYDYYVSNMKETLRQTMEQFPELDHVLETRHGGDMNGYLNGLFLPVSTSDEWAKEIVQLVCSDDDSKPDERNQIYIDFTGGSRVASLTSLFLARILEAVHAEVQQIVYADLLTKPEAITDCTEQYAFLSSIENLAIAKESPKAILEELQRIGFAGADIDMDAAEKLDKLEKASREKYTKSSEESRDALDSEFGSFIHDSEGIAKAVLRQSYHRVQRNWHMSGYQKLYLRPDQKLITDFHSSLMNIFLDEDIIRCTNPREQKPKPVIEESMKANESYYFGTEKLHGVLPELRCWMEELQAHPEYHPKNMLLRRQKPNDPCYFDFTASYPKRVNEVAVKLFLTYMAEHMIKPGGVSLQSQLRNYSRMQTVFFNYGFPFMCMGVGSNDRFYKDLYTDYSQKVHTLMERLEQLFLNDKAAYRAELSRLLADPAALQDAVPFLAVSSCWEVNPSRFSSEAEVLAFTHTFCEQMKFIRPYRNAISHDHDNEYAEYENQEKAAAQLRVWLLEYEERFHKE